VVRIRFYMTSKKIKEIVLISIFVGLGFSTWYFLYRLFYRNLNDLKILAFFAAFSIAFGIFFSIVSFFVGSKKLIFLSFALISFSPAFIFGFNLFLLAGLGVFFILIFFGFRSLKTEKDVYSLKLRPRWILSRGLSQFFLGFSLVISLIFYFSPAGEFKMEIPKPLFDKIFGYLQPLISAQLPALDPKMTIDEFLVTQYILLPRVQTGAYSASNNNFLSFFRNPAFAEVSKITQHSDEAYLKKLISQNQKTLQAGKNGLSNTLGIEITGTETVKEVLFYLVNKQLVLITKPYEEYISIGFVLAIFLTLLTVNLPYKWLTGFFAWILFKIFVVSGLAKTQKEMVEKENITL